jgi:hypothetical protein
MQPTERGFYWCYVFDLCGAATSMVLATCAAGEAVKARTSDGSVRHALSRYTLACREADVCLEQYCNSTCVDLCWMRRGRLHDGSSSCHDSNSQTFTSDNKTPYFWVSFSDLGVWDMRLCSSSPPTPEHYAREGIVVVGYFIHGELFCCRTAHGDWWRERCRCPHRRSRESSDKAVRDLTESLGGVRRKHGMVVNEG